MQFQRYGVEHAHFERAFEEVCLRLCALLPFVHACGLLPEESLDQVVVGWFVRAQVSGIIDNYAAMTADD